MANAKSTTKPSAKKPPPFHPIAIVGVLMVVCGIVTWIHPRFELPAQEREVQINDNKAIISTKRIITFPVPFSIILVVAGATQIFLVKRR
jgi:ribose/xylose/arabinose/galactoside ABC-type transport system permease subunit